MTLPNQLKDDLKRLTRIAANLTEAHSCVLFLPTGLRQQPELLSASEFSAAAPVAADQPPHGIVSRRTTTSAGTPPPQGAIQLKRIVEAPTAPQKLLSIELVAAHTNSSSLVRDCRIQVGSGLLGWVAEQGRPMHIAPFETESSSLGIYSEPEQLRSLAALPVPMPSEYRDAESCFGVLVCDSKRATPFSKVQMKLLEDLSTEISRLLFWALFKVPHSAVESSWESFLARTENLGSAIGVNSIEFLRVGMPCLSELEQRGGVSATVRMSEQFFRLVQQALPPHFPIVRLPQGEILIALDNMMSAFFKTKLHALAKHMAEEFKGFGVAIHSFAARAHRGRGLDIDAILQLTNASGSATPITSASISSASTNNTPTKILGGSRA